MIRLTNLSKALILKMGGIRDRARAIDIFEDILSYYPTGMDRFHQITNRSIDIKMNLIELYLYDLANDLLGNTKKNIDKLMLEIEKSPLMHNPTTISEYSSYQILVAKYNFYVEGDINKALDILDSLRKEAEKYKMQKIIDQIKGETHFLETEIAKWENIDLSIQERLVKSQLTEYIQKALNIVKI